MADPVLNITFGDGTINPGPALPDGNTAYKYTSALCPGNGEYTIARNNNKCGSPDWITIFRDHTFRFNETRLDGYMMLVDGYATDVMVYYTDTVEGLCSNANYLFSAAYGILGNCGSSGGDANILFRVTTMSGQLVASAAPGSSNLLSFQMLKYANGFYFKVPEGESRIIISLSSRLPNKQYCGNKLWIDDIQVRPTDGPQVTISGGSGNFVTSVCFQQNATIIMHGQISPSHAAVQWQQSTDTVTWHDIPGERALNYSRIFSVPGNFLFRLRASEPAVIDNINCSMISNYIIVQVDGIPNDFKISSNSPVCLGQPLTLNAPKGFAKYRWTGPNGFHDDIYYPQTYHTTLEDSGMYYAEVTTPGGCKAKDSVRVTIIDASVKIEPSDTAICKGSAVMLKAMGGIKYQWVPTLWLSNDTIANPVASPDETTTYTVLAYHVTGCTATDSVRIVLKNEGKIIAGVLSPGFICRPVDTVTFKNESVGNIIGWHWDFGNGQTSVLKDPPQQSFYIGNEENYHIKLAVSDSSGCTDTAYHVIQVADNCYIAVPSAFTPNGDGKNDYLYPLNAYKAKDLVFRVFNRNGQLIFITRDWTNKWDGRINGFLQATGVFVWTLEYTGENNKRVSLNGTTTLIR